MKRYLKPLILCVLLLAGCVGWAQCPQNFVHIVGRQNPLCDTSLLDWATWSTVTATSGTAVISSNITVTVTKPTGGLSTSPNMFAGGLFPTQYNIPVNNTVLRNDLAGLFTFCFSTPVVNPVIALASIGNGNLTVPVVTSAPYNVIWAGPGMTYPNDTTFDGTEGYTIIQFIGTFSCISFNYLQSETYCNVTFGVIDTNCQTYAIPPVCPGNPDTLHATGAVTYTWTPAYGLNTTTGGVVIANPLVSTTYFATGTDANNCIATDSFTVQVLSAYNDTVTQNICQGNTYSFNGNTYSQTGNYSYFYQTVNGCDSEVTLHLTVDSVYISTTLATICQGSSYTFQGNTYTIAGNYPFNYTSIYGCDSDYTLQLTVNPVYYDTMPQTICQGGSYTFAGNTYTTAGSYNINYQTMRGCDSIITIVLTVNPIYSDTITQSICTGGSYTYNGNSYTQAGYYPVTLQTVNGCDSTVTLNLDVNPVYYDTTVAAICNGASYNFQGTAYNATGVYLVSYTTVNGCDSVLILILTVNPIYYDTIPQTICQGGNYAFAGHAYTTGGSYNVNYQTVNGCDSVYTIILTVNPTYYDTITQNICAGNSYTFLGSNYTQTGYYSTPYQTVEGCDSVITLHLIINPVYYDTTSAGICNGASYAFQGSTYTATGVYTASYTSVSGCDSDLTLALTVNPTYSDTVSSSICNGQTYNLPNGTPVTTAGVYSTTLNTIHGCDSVITTQLQVYPTYYQSRTDTVCADQKFVLPDGSTVTGGGLYLTKLSTINSCDSTISTELFVQSEPVWFQAFITPAADTVSLGKSVTLTAGSNQSGPLTYTWAPTYGLSCSDCPTTQFTGNITTAYTVAITDTNGCYGTAGVNVEVIPNYQVFIPNVFTPNGDGHNDQWQIFGNKTAMKLLQVLLFDRSGEKVFESSDINFIWDGTYRGKPAPAGVYAYIITIVWLNNVTVEPYKGTVTLLR